MHADDSAEIDVDGDDPSFYNKCFTLPQYILDKPVLPDWFPSSTRGVFSAFTDRTLTVDVDRLNFLSLKYAFFVYRGLLRSGHKKSILPPEKVKYDGRVI